MNFLRKWAVLLFILCCFTTLYSSGQPLLQQTPQTANFPVDSCATYTFRLQLGNGNYENHLNDVSTYSDSGFMYHVGYTTINGDRDGLLQMTDRTGQLIWSKTLGIPGRAETIEAVSLMRNGNVVMTGTLEQSGNQKPFIIAAAPDGTVLWMKSIQTPTSYRGKAVVATRIYGIGFAAEDDSTVVYGRLENNGTLVTMKRLRLLQNSRVVGMVNEGYHDFTIAFTGTDSARKVGGIVFIRGVWNDVFVHKLGGVAQNKDFIIHKMQILNLRARVTGIYAANNGPYKLFRAVLLGGLQNFESFNTPGISFDETASTALTAWTDVIAFKTSAASTDLYVTKALNPYELDNNRDSGFYWAKQFAALPNFELADVERTFDAGNLATLNLTGQNKQWMLKVDSAGNSPGCAGNNFSFSRVLDYDYQGHLSEVFPAAVNYPMQTETVTPQPATIDTAFQCRQLTCPTQPLEDTCRLSFHRVFRSFNATDGGSSLSVLPNNNILVSGSTNAKPEVRRSAGFFALFDSTARLLQRKIYSSNSEASIAQHILLQDGNVLASGYNFVDDTTHYIAITKFSASLAPLWNRSFRWVGYASYQTTLMESGDGSIFLSYQDSWTVQHDFALLKLDPNGNLLWLKNYRPFPGGVFGANQSAGPSVQDEHYIYFSGQVYSPVQGTVLMKIEKATGNLVWAKRMHHASMKILASHRLLLMNDKLLLFGVVEKEGMGAYSHNLVLMFDKNGTFVRSRSLSADNTTVFSLVTRMSNGDVVFTGYHPNSIVSGYNFMSTFLRLDSNLQVRNSRRTYELGRGAPADVEEAPDGSIYETGAVWYRETFLNTSLFVRKRMANGMLGNCFNDTLIVAFNTADPLVTDVTFSPTNGTVNFEQFTYTEKEYTLQQNRVPCASPVECTLLKVLGSNNVCRDTTYEYRIQRNAGCNAAANWSFSSPQVQVVAVHDSMVRVRFLANGNFYVKARLFTGCRWLEDSLQVSVLMTDDSLNLGVDGGICPGNTRILRAGPNFQTYLWQDGSTDSVFTVTLPGTYYVTTTNGCGEVFSDTVIISNAPPVPFDLGPDVSKCNNDSLTITAPAGFMNYQWSPAYNISSTTGQSVLVFPATTTMYKVTAEKTPGCFAYDSITVRVNNSPPVNLGTDISFCSGDSVVLYAGSGFVQYQWSTGASADRITVKTKGRYFVVATDANLCRSADTTEVLNVFTNPAVDLSTDSLLCTGDNRTLNAGSGFSQYTWHNGFTGSSITVNAPGKYWVTVRDANGCYGNDTSTITRMLPLPANFLPSDTTLCTYSKLTVIPAGSFRTYAWSTGATSSTLTVDKAGIYSLRVEDAFGCKGSDDIIISPKDCLQGIFFPNAFTPNNDRKNDAFKPIVYGPLVNFRLIIYNRWGSKVFETSDWQTGWNGTLGGLTQQNDTFLWICTYQFQNEAAKVEKGAVILIR
jgi:gliding motility-associated-like protein